MNLYRRQAPLGTLAFTLALSFATIRCGSDTPTQPTTGPAVADVVLTPSSTVVSTTAQGVVSLVSSGPGPGGDHFTFEQQHSRGLGPVGRHCSGGGVERRIYHHGDVGWCDHNYCDLQWQQQISDADRHRDQPCLRSISLSPVSVVGGNPVTGTVTLTGGAPAAGAVVTLSGSDPVTCPRHGHRGRRRDHRDLHRRDPGRW